MDEVDLSKITIQSLSKDQAEQLLSQFSSEDIAKAGTLEDLRKILRKLRDAQNQKFVDPGTTDESENESESVVADNSKSIVPQEEKPISSATVPQAQEQNKQNTETSVETDEENQEDETTMEKHDNMEYNKNLYTWDEYIMKWELFFAGYDTKEERKTPLFLTKAGHEILKLAIDLCAPEKPNTKTFAQLTKILGDHIASTKNTKMERYTFSQAVQKPSESISEFVAKLKDLSLNCKFDKPDDALCDRFICGVVDQETRIALFSEQNLTFSRALEIAKTREAAVKNANKTQKQSGPSSIQHMGHQQQRGGKKTTSYGAKQAEAKYSGNKDSNKKRSNFSANPNLYCYCCGRNNHLSRDCFFKERAFCKFCKKQGHYEVACLIKKGEKPASNSQGNKFYKKKDKNLHLLRDESEDSDSQTESICGCNCKNHSKIQSIKSLKFDTEFYSIESENEFNNCQCYKIKAEPMFIDIEVNNRTVKMELDTGTYVTAISEQDKHKYFSNLTLDKVELVLTSYGGNVLEPLGKLKNLKVKFNNIEKILDIYVIKGKGPMLLGRQWLKAFDLWPINSLMKNPQKSNIHNILTSEGVKQKMLEKFPDLFSNTQGCYKGRKIHLVFKEGTKPIQLKPYHAPFAILPKISKELQRLVDLGNLEKVSCSKWATPIIPVLKKTGDVRICGNFKVTVNPQLVIKRHPIPLKEKIFNTLRIGNKWSQVDLRHAFMQLVVDNESREALTIITHEGLYRYTKLGEGIASSPAECQDIIEEILKGVKNTEIYIDNIYCTGATDQEHLEILTEIFDKLEKAGLRVNLDKCDFFKDEIEILGFVINNRGLQPSESKINAIKNVPIPKNIEELEAFLGLVNFYERFLKNRADYVKPLYDLCKSKNFEWNKECQRGFDWIKSQITSDNVLALFNPNEKLVLACDASNHGLSAILSHRYVGGFSG
ncbi:PREDICTED: uncharacterized protein K02A2.6-like [Wasmannia auropunctata]|uniref:uncharacterized protein K02A2.6-like n=1 Tax=Wasmannia auropunctata TaxID=64793 RepID=UPI0005F0A64F|nr:PREDICTED: uncharacterized protein K02A2.6-like [Wasmannia auropunctata]